jgi:hypothetical protein
MRLEGTFRPYGIGCIHDTNSTNFLASTCSLSVCVLLEGVFLEQIAVGVIDFVEDINQAALALFN